MELFTVLIIAAAGLVTYLGIVIFRKRCVDRKWLDFPNHRSSHTDPTPRGAGIVVVPVCLIGYFLAVALSGIHLSWGYFLGALLVAVVSWIDDLYSISFIWRLITHLLAALIVIASEGYWINLSFGNGDMHPLGWLGLFATVLWIVWVINAYNFMDGIDGIAAVQGLAAAASWAFVFASGKTASFLFPMVIFASLLGFILHNWHPAKVFIGDVGSAFLGFTFASMPLLFARENPENSSLLPLISILILWPFLFDSVVTLVRRAFRGEMVWNAHREHMYQLLVISGVLQSTVSMIYGIFAIFTAVGALLVLNGVVNLALIIALTVILSAILAFAVTLTYKRHSRIAEVPHGV